MGAEVCVLASKYLRHEPEILVEQSSVVTFEDLRLNTNYGIYVTQTSNFCLHSIHFLSTAAFSELVITDPVGDYTIMESLFAPHSHIYTSLRASPYTSKESCIFNFTFKCQLETTHGLHIIMDNQTHYDSIKIIISKSTFTNNKLSVVATSYPISSITLEVKNVTFNRGWCQS